MIYLDNAATTLKKPEAVIEAVADAMRNMGNSGRGSGSTSLRASRVIYEARRTLTEFFGGTDPSRLVFTSNSTEGLNMAIRGIFVPGDHVITTELEHNSVLRPLYGEQEQNGISLTIVKSGKQGTVDYEGIEAAHPAGDKGCHLYPCLQSYRKCGGSVSYGTDCETEWPPICGGCVPDGGSAAH